MDIGDVLPQMEWKICGNGELHVLHIGLQLYSKPHDNMIDTNHTDRKLTLYITAIGNVQ